ncbi:hypothetical protein Tco_0771697 [Tanacetum coccineum]|uniref:Uncharacterized protein n=1 Tax=Tanacetum coccineum TaxID=301880 RepID=A0ABQ4ZH43_9ASTR
MEQSAGGKLRDHNAKESWALLEDLALYDNERNSMVYKSNAARHDEREELRKKGIKSPSKLFSLKYLSIASIKELNKNPSALKYVYFVNSIVVLSTDSDTKEEDTSSTNAHEHELDDMNKYVLILTLEKEHTKLVYLRNEEDKRRGVEKFFIKNKNFVFTERGDGVTIYTLTPATRTCDMGQDFPDRAVKRLGYIDEKKLGKFLGRFHGSRILG